MQPIANHSIVLSLYTALQYRSSKSSNFLVFYTSGGISSRPTTFLFLILVSTTSSSSWVNCPSLMSNRLLIIFVRSLSVTFGEFPNRFLKCSFHMWIRSFWLSAFSIAFKVLFFLFTLFTVCHAIRDCLSSTEFLILLIWLWMYSICSFLYLLISSLCAFLSFWALAFVRFLFYYTGMLFLRYLIFFYLLMSLMDFYS